MSGSFLVHRLRDQTYWLYLPSEVDPHQPLPLLVMLHGCGQSAAEFANGSRMNQHAGQQPCAVLYPEQDRSANSLRCWNWFEPETLAGHAESKLIGEIVLDAQTRYPIDPTRRYVVGFSAGAAMAAVLCTTHANLFAGCAMHSGLMAQAATNLSQAMQFMRRGADPEAFDRSVRDIVGRLRPSARIVPTLVLHGSLDTVVNPVNAQQIAEQFRLVASELSTVAPSFSTERWIESTGRAYRQQDMMLADTLLLRTILVEGLGHAWSGGDPRREYFDEPAPDATALILEFLLARPPNDAG